MKGEKNEMSKKRVKPYEDYIEDRVQEFEEIIADALEPLQPLSIVPRKSYGRFDIEVTALRERTDKEEASIYAMDVLAIILAVFIAIVPFFRPEWQVAWAFSAVLVFSVFSRSIVLRLAAMLISTLTLVLGVFIDLMDVVYVVFGMNTITLGPIVVALLMTALVAGAGVVHGLTGSTRYSGAWILALGTLMASLDTLIGVFGGGIPEWWMLFTVHLIIYWSGYLICWGLFYLLCRSVRWGVLVAGGK